MIRVNRGRSYGASLTPNAPDEDPATTEHIDEWPAYAESTNGRSAYTERPGGCTYIYLCTFLCGYIVEDLYFGLWVFLALLVAEHEEGSCVHYHTSFGPGRDLWSMLWAFREAGVIV